MQKKHFSWHKQHTQKHTLSVKFFPADTLFSVTQDLSCTSRQRNFCAPPLDTTYKLKDLEFITEILFVQSLVLSDVYQIRITALISGHFFLMCRSFSSAADIFTCVSLLLLSNTCRMKWHTREHANHILLKSLIISALVVQDCLFRFAFGNLNIRKLGIMSTVLWNMSSTGLHPTQIKFKPSLFFCLF